MKEEVLLKIKNDYETLKNKIEKYNKKYEKVFVLQKCSQVKEYMDIMGIEEIHSIIPSIQNKKNLHALLASYRKDINGGSGVYLYLGSNKEASEFYYQELDSFVIKILSEYDCDSFMKNNQVIFTDSDLEIKGLNYMLENVFPIVRDEYLLKAFDFGEEKAKEYILEKYKNY